MHKVFVLSVLVLSLLASACASTSRAPSVTESGFLGPDFNLLEPGSEGQAQQRYLKPGVDWAAYRNVVLEPVTLWRGKESRDEGVSQKDAQLLANYFYGVIKQALQKEGFQLVDAAQPNTLRVAVAITKPHEADVGLNVISTVVPQLHLLSSLGSVATGKPAFVGEAQVEAKVNDANSGELLAAGIDHRIGGKVLNSAELTSWGQVEEMMRLWANHGSYNLCELQKRTDCVAPPES